MFLRLGLGLGTHASPVWGVLADFIHALHRHAFFFVFAWIELNINQSSFWSQDAPTDVTRLSLAVQFM